MAQREPPTIAYPPTRVFGHSIFEFNFCGSIICCSKNLALKCFGFILTMFIPCLALFYKPPFGYEPEYGSSIAIFHNVFTLFSLKWSKYYNFFSIQLVFFFLFFCVTCSLHLSLWTAAWVTFNEAYASTGLVSCCNSIFLQSSGMFHAYWRFLSLSLGFFSLSFFNLHPLDWVFFWVSFSSP